MKKQIIILQILALLFSSIGLHAQRICGTMEGFNEHLRDNPSSQDKINELENYTKIFSETYKQKAGFQTIYVIPVIVHVVWNTPQQNISDDQINSQLEVLNEDFRKLNADASNIPELFRALAADCEIQFCLARNGIRRIQTNKVSFNNNNDIKWSNRGGSNAIEPTQYLNIWVGNLSGGLLGYAQFPNDPRYTIHTDGIVITTTAFGKRGNVDSPYNLGRTATHEVGHWLNLKHIWGNAVCGNDMVDDTPIHHNENRGCPTHPHTNECDNTTTAEMFMNYMDYTNDECQHMFSIGQKVRMLATLTSVRSGVILSTQLTATVQTPICEGSSFQLSANSIAGASYRWTGPNGFSSSNATVFFPNAQFTQSGQYIITADYSGCITKADTVEVRVEPSPTVSLRNDTIICSGASIALQANAGGNRYRWNTGETTHSIQVRQTGIYSVTVTNGAGCSKRDTMSLVVTDSIRFKVTPTGVCESNQNGKIVTTGINGGFGAPYTVAVNGQTVANGHTLTGLKAGQYTVQVKDIKGCLSDSYKTEVVSLPQLEVYITPNTVVKLGDSSKLEVKVLNRTNMQLSYRWLPEPLSCDTCQTIFVKPLQYTVYRAVVKDTVGCTSEQLVRVSVSKEGLLWIPNAFSPNADGNNEKLLVFGTAGVKRIIHFQIFNRWGNLVYSGADFAPNDENMGWDGTFKEERVPISAYLWRVTAELIDGSIQELAGNVTPIY
jgi:gliding motility-associated-like protein